MKRREELEELYVEDDDGEVEDKGGYKLFPIKGGQERICAVCGGDAEWFRDFLSVKEYRISGLCQMCQDEVFGPGPCDEGGERDGNV